ncbi:hypothetical protein PR048_028240 [Dryococelus australis]|uniref:Helicase ATP-binding domain-containing protein n=1 Tax=Dryococelus australis TaxID=614101 RepID=A0ABQ9GIR1_9NEOP|nr:hypothetical protein PR048_028240 [Dryococelus australis]
MALLHVENEPDATLQEVDEGNLTGVPPVTLRSSVKYVIGGVTVYFPVRAYPSQIAVMDKVIRGIVNARNCLLESPTGTGKTLALLCSSLAWQRKEEERVAELTAQVAFDLGSSPTKESSLSFDYDRVPTGYCCDPQTFEYDDDFECPPHKTPCPRSVVGKTHIVNINNSLTSQGSAADVSKQTFSKESDCSSVNNCVVPRVPRIYYATRTHKQIEQVVRELKKTEYKNVRMTVLSSREHSCIRDLNGHHSKTELCRELLDPLTGPGCFFNSNVKNMSSHASLESVGFETPWDIEDLVKLGRSRKTCPYFLARSLMSSAKLIFCPYNYLIDPLIRESMQLDIHGEVVILDEAHNIEDSSREAASFSVAQDDLQLAINDITSVMHAGTLRSIHEHMAMFLEQLSEFINSHKVSIVFSDFDEGHCALTGTMAVGHLSLLNIGPKEYPAFRNSVEACLAQLKNSEPNNSTKGKASIHVISAATRSILEGLLLTFDFMYGDSLIYCDDFRVVITKSMSRNPLDFQNKKKRHNSEWKYFLHFWCQNPALVFHELQASARSIILTSGTLAPVDSFQSELGTMFHIQLQATHIIPKSQLWVGSVPCGPQGYNLCATYNNTETHSFQDELGLLVLSVCEKVPFGVVCFLPSYRLLDKLVERWQATGLWWDFESLKTVVMEPRRAGELDGVMRDFHKSIREYETAGEADGEQTGALLFAVFRGKVSEGFDFADNNARAVIAVGIPFLNSKNIQVNLKKSHNNQNWAKRGLLDGNKWYQIQAYRALNQALGRCIRHRNDWGAILLVDSRFRGNPSYVNQLSKWLKNYMHQYSDWPSMHQSLSNFMIQRRAGKLENTVI